MKYLSVILISLFFLMNLNAQAIKVDQKIPADTLKTELNPNASINELKQILFQEAVSNPYRIHIEQQVSKIMSDSYDINSGYTSLHIREENSFNSAKENMLGAIRSQPKFLPANELGVLGQIFLYVNAAAAGYAVYQHIKKYKDEY